MRIRRGEYLVASTFGRLTRHEEVDVIRISISIFVIAVILASSFVAFSQTSVFLYQGRLNDGGNPANGTYDMQFKLFDALGGGTQIGATQTNASVTVSAGTFAVSLDFGVNAFTGANRFLEIGVRPAGNPNPHTLLAPRTQILTAPYSIRSNTSATADLATNATTATTATNAQQLGGVAASEYVNNTNLGDKAIRNQTTLQANSNFSISGNGFFGNRAGIGTTTPLHRLALAGGPPWTTHAWGGSVDMDNGSAIGWRANAGGTRFGMGHSTDGFFMFRTISELGTATAAPIYDFKMDNAGSIGIGSLAINTDVSQARLNIFNLSLGYGVLNTLGSVSVGSYVDASGGSYGTRSNHPLRFFTNNGPPQLTLATSGNFGIGTESPSQLVHVNSIGNAASLVQTATNAFAQYQLKSGPANTWTIGTQDNFALGGLLFRYGGTDLMNIMPSGAVTQPRDESGLVKAMIYVGSDGSILRCYNGITGSTTGNCGFTINHFTAGGYGIDFGFQVTDRFISVSVERLPLDVNYGIEFNFASTSSSCNVRTYRSGQTNTTEDARFMIIVY